MASGSRFFCISLEPLFIPKADNIIVAIPDGLNGDPGLWKCEYSVYTHVPMNIMASIASHIQKTGLSDDGVPSDSLNAPAIQLDIEFGIFLIT